VCAGDIVEEREILSKLLLAKADRELFSLILQLVRVPCFDLQSGKVCDSLSVVFFFWLPTSFSFPSLVLLALKQSVLRCVICIFLMVYGCVEPLVGGGVFGL
jgi:hypothetical protein